MHTILFTYLLTPWSRILLQKLSGLQLVKKFPHFLKPECSLPHSQMPSTCSNPNLARSSLYPYISLLVDASYFPIYTLVFKVVPLPQVSLPRTCISLASPHTCYMPHPSHSSPFGHPNNIGWRVQIIKLLIVWFSPLLWYLVHLRPKYSSQHPILKHPQPTFLPQCERPSCTPIRNNRQNYSSVLIFRFLESKLEDKIFCTNDSQHFLTSF